MIFSYISGIGAGLLGIGGGMILNPILLNLGYIPTISSALAGFSVLFTSSSTTTQFIIAGAIKIQEALIFLIFSSIGSLIGNLIILRIVKKYNKPSILVWILFSVLLLCCLILPINSFLTLLKKEKIFYFNNPC